MNLRTAFCVSGMACVLVVLVIALLLPIQGAHIVNVGNRLAPPGSTHLFGTDELGRDVFYRFIVGSRYTILTGCMTALLAGAVGYLMGGKARSVPRWFVRLTTVLAHVCFVVPAFLLAPRWPSRLLTTILCLLAILPLFIIALIVVSVADLTGWTTALVIGPLWGIGIAYVLNRNHSPGAATALMASVFAWAILQHGALDVLGLGVQPPTPSWGSLFVAQTTSWWPHAAAVLSVLVIGALAFTLSDLMSRKN